MGAALGALLSHWTRRPFQLLTLVIGLATATALWSGVQAINAQARQSYADAANRLGEADLPVIEARGGGDLAQARFIALRRAGWQVAPIIEGQLASGDTAILLIGIDPLSMPPGRLPGGAGFGAEPGAGLDADFLAPPGVLLTGPETASQLEGALPVPVRAAEGMAEGRAYADIGIAQRLLNRPGRIDRMLVTGPGSLGAPSLERIAPDLAQRRPSGEDDALGRLTDSFHLNLTAFGLLAFAVGLFIVRGAIGLAFEQRRPVFRTLRALGVSRNALLGLLAAELAALALVSGAAGMGLGYLLAGLLLPDVAATLRGLYGAQVEGALSIRPAWWLAGLAIALAGTALAAAGSFWQVARLPLLAPAQPRAWALASRKLLRGQQLAALALAAAAIALALWGSGLIAGFALLGAALLAAALLLPSILQGALALGARTARGVVQDWFWADTRQQVPGLSLALMALLLALSANIGVGTMVSSFRLTFTGWLDQRLAAELYVTAPDAETAARMREYLAPRTGAILPIVQAEARIDGQPGAIYGVADHATYRRNWPLLGSVPGVWDRIAAGGSVLINEQLSRRAGLVPGDKIDLPGGRFNIAGIYSDYGNPAPQVMMGLTRFESEFPEVPQLRFALRVPPEAAADLARALRAQFGLGDDAVVDQAAVKALSLAIFERTFTVTAALNVLTLSVAGLAILTSLLTLGTMRLPQLAPVWSLGLTRARLARLELTRAILLAAITFLAAVPTGLLLAWVLLSIINVEAFGWRLPMHVFPGDWLRLGVLSLLAAALASLWPSIRIARTPPSDLLKVFANER
ncbi:ABC transporter permease [Profundibacterium mesophilum]|uniref:ABC transporter permease n=1 Tax=Profundibacterium mesophilum TaxID=1258573 RepID=UPI00135C9EA6|nr:ABC transporter permease [Profundibacterium mesophilum]